MANFLTQGTTPSRYQCIAALLMAGLFVSCGGNGQGLNANGRPLWEVTSSTTTPSTETSVDGTFNRIQRDILTPDCATSGCHSGTSAPLGLSLDAGQAYNNLTNRPSIQVSSIFLVEPSNPDASYLIQKLEGTQSGGLQMPLAKPPLTADKITLLRQWILEGAAAPAEIPPDAVDTGQEETPNNPLPQPVLAATLSSIQNLIFDPKCAGCHSGDAPLGQLNLTEGQSYTQLVERPAAMDPDAMLLVAMGNASGSFLIDKLRGSRLGTEGGADYRGQRMPVVGGYLNDVTMQIIETWINEGALNN